MLINIFASFVSFCFSCCFFLFHFFFSSLFIKCAVLLFLLFSLCHDIKLIRIYVIILICAIHGATLLSLSLLCVCVYAQQMEYFLTDASSLNILISKRPMSRNKRKFFIFDFLISDRKSLKREKRNFSLVFISKNLKYAPVEVQVNIFNEIIFLREKEEREKIISEYEKLTH